MLCRGEELSTELWRRLVGLEPYDEGEEDSIGLCPFAK